MKFRLSEVKYVDAHTHLAGFTDQEVERIVSAGILTFAVAYDLPSIERVLYLARKYPNVVPFVGVHPWELSPSKISDRELERVIEYVKQRAREAFGLGEVGLDMRFCSDYFDRLVRVFERLAEIAAEMNLAMNVHALDAWNMALRIVTNAGVKKVIFHWYSGPIDVLREIEAQGYYITINPCVTFQQKHGVVLKYANIDNVLTESDGPYEYRGVKLHPNMIPGLIEHIARVKGMDIEETRKIIVRNAYRFLGL